MEPIENVKILVSKNRTKPISKFKNRKLSFRCSVFKKPTLTGWFFTLSHSQFIFQHARINSHSIFSSCHYLCTSSSESLRLTSSWTNSGNSKLKSTRYSAYTLNNTQCQKTNRKKETAVKFVKPKLSQKPQLIAELSREPNQSNFLPTAHH